MTRVQTMNGDNDNSKFLLQEKLRYVFTSMKIFGVYHDPSRSQDGGSNEIGPALAESTSDSTRIKNTFRYIFSHRNYAILMLCISILHSLFHFVSIFLNATTFEGLMVMRITALSLILQETSSRLFLFISLEKKDRFQTLKQHCSINNPDDTTEYRKLCYDKIKKKVRIFTWIAWLKIAADVIFISVFLISDRSDIFTHVLINPLPNNFPVRILMSVIYGYTLAVWNLSILYIVTMCSCLNADFEIFNHYLKTLVEKENKNALKHVEKYRLQHKHICDAVEIVEKDFKYLIATVDTANIFLCCFMVYTLINYPPPLVFIIVMQVVFSFVGIVFVFLVTIATAFTNEAAHSTLENIYNIDLSESTAQQIAQLNLWVSKLTAAPIGFSFIGLITVTKEFILTLAGVLGTYFFLLLEFKI